VADSTPGGSVTAIIRDGELTDVHAEGQANAATGEPLTPSSIFYVGSIAKQFVAACALLLTDEGALDLEAPVGSIVEDLPSWADTMRVRQLVHHTSGMRDRDHSMHPGVPVTGVPARGNEEELDRIRVVRALATEPGTEYRYANRGYHLLGHAVARASGSPVARFAHDRLFEPLGMTETFFRDALTPLPPNAARGHFEAVDGNTYVEPALFHAVGAGGLWTTVADLVRWDAAFYDDPQVAPRLARRGNLDDGTPIHYGWGLSIRTHRGLPIQSHGGSFPGWNAKMVRFPTERATVIVLANTEGLDPSAMAFLMADDLLGDRLDQGAPHADDTFDGVS
jgi:CubicO group peptidase (beta-lactamase class C family)